VLLECDGAGGVWEQLEEAFGEVGPTRKCFIVKQKGTQQGPVGPHNGSCRVQRWPLYWFVSYVVLSCRSVYPFNCSPCAEFTARDGAWGDCRG
jgi:hypothetical protein